MQKQYFYIGDIVYCSKYRLSGEVTNKYIFHNMFEKKVYCLVKVDKTVFGDSSFGTYLLSDGTRLEGLMLKDWKHIFVNYDLLKSIKPSHMYKSRTYPKTRIEHLKKSDIKWGNMVSFVDNNYFERIVEEEVTLFDYTILRLNEIINKKLYLTGNIITSNGIDYAECITNRSLASASKYEIPIDCLKLTKKISKFKSVYYKVRGFY